MAVVQNQMLRNAIPITCRAQKNLNCLDYFNTKEVMEWSIKICLQMIFDHRKFHLCDHALAIGSSENLLQYCKSLFCFPG